MSAETSTRRPSVGARVGTVYGVLLNDVDAWTRLQPAFGESPYQRAPSAPILYIKPRNTVVQDGAAVAIPADPGVVRVDGTVGVVIARDATRVDAADALSFVGHYVIASDLVLPHASIYRPAVRLRCRDGFCPMGDPVAAGSFDLGAAIVTISINGVVRHRRAFAGLVRPLPQLLADITEFMTLTAGDVVLVGPPDAAPEARAGDVVAIDVPGLGRLTHSIVAEGAAR